MKYISICSGIEAASVAWAPLGWQPVAFAEIEPFPSAVLAHHYPDVPNVGDITKVNWSEYHGKANVVIGGTPCFAAGELVLTPHGYVEIQDIKIGDTVIDFNGEHRKVTNFGSKLARVGELKILGKPKILCTENHPFHCVKTKTEHSRKACLYGTKVADGEFKKTQAKDSVGMYAARPVFKPFDGISSDTFGNLTLADTVELAGWYVGDGYIRRWKDKNKKAIILALVSDKKIQLFTKRFKGKINFFTSKDGKVSICNTILAEWLINNFGELSHDKKIPYWLYAHKYKDNFFYGYCKTDGHETETCYKISTVSKKLAFGIADLYQNSSLCIHTPAKTKVIEGRTVNQRVTYIIQVYKNNTPRTKKILGHYSSLVRSFDYDDTSKPVRVYNITVEHSHTYIVNGIATYNCQAFSLAGNRKGIADERGQLTLKFVEILQAVRPEWFIWENVPGVLSTNGGEDFACFLRAISEIGYSYAYRILDAQHFGVPQRRRRIFLVGHSTDWRCAAKVLFERDSLQRDITQSGGKGQSVAGGVESGVAGTDLYSDVGHSKFKKDSIVGTLRAAGGCLGGGSEAFVYDHHQQDSRIKEVSIAPTVMSSWDNMSSLPLVYENNPTDGRLKQVSVCPTVLSRYGTGGNQIPLVLPINTQSLLRNFKKGDRVGFGIGENGDPANTLQAAHSHGVFSNNIIRRLTPLECERLQGFPQNWTRIPYRNKAAEDCPDSPRYKAIGNSMAVPVVRWIGERIQGVNNGTI